MWILAAGFILSVFFVPASIAVRPDYILPVLMCVIGYVKFGDRLVKLAIKEARLILWLAFFAIISIAGQYFAGSGLSSRDFMVVVRYVVYLATIYAGLTVALSMRSSGLLRLLSLLLVLALIAISFSQYFNLGGINSFLVPFYSEEGRYATLEAGMSWRRIIGTMGNPNYWGFLLGLGFTYAGYMCLQKHYMHIALVIPLFIALIMTGSRTSLVATMVAMLVGFFLMANTGKKASLKSMMPILAGVAFFGLIYFVFSLFLANFYESENRFASTNLGTLELRIQWWFEIFRKMFDQPHTFIIGQGPAKLESVRFGDNMYIRYLRDFGIIGLSLYMMLLFNIFKKLYRLSRLLKQKSSIFLVVVFLGFVQLAVFDLAADGWFNVRIAELLLFAYGLAVGSAYKNIWRKSKDESIHNNT